MAFFNPHASGLHTFFLSSDDEGGLWSAQGNNISNIDKCVTFDKCVTSALYCLVVDFDSALKLDDVQISVTYPAFGSASM